MSSTFSGDKRSFLSLASSALLLPSSSPVWELHMKQQKVEINPKAKSYCLFDGYAHLSSGLTYGLVGVSKGMAIGIVGDAGVSTITLIGYYILIKYVSCFTSFVNSMTFCLELSHCDPNALCYD
ncbi:hypothetical protein Patl1_35133 [Pistacia atlantica]|uniref:Uncharacterized protein n=1 Tax=Pistacia atlantica TaxID=434234 RepID=A0ACC0ZV97_9ROSI|nr:hypothetical protein Patl1_35133 [Pistacia atlantica]